MPIALRFRLFVVACLGLGHPVWVFAVTGGVPADAVLADSKGRNTSPQTSPCRNLLKQPAPSSHGAVEMVPRGFRDSLATPKVIAGYGQMDGPVLVLQRGVHGLRQIAVTLAADLRCREFAIFAPVDGQRPVLSRMFDALMKGEKTAARNPF